MVWGRIRRAMGRNSYYFRWRRRPAGPKDSSTELRPPPGVGEVEEAMAGGPEAVEKFIEEELRDATS